MDVFDCEIIKATKEKKKKWNIVDLKLSDCLEQSITK